MGNYFLLFICRHYSLLLLLLPSQQFQSIHLRWMFVLKIDNHLSQWQVQGMNTDVCMSFLKFFFLLIFSQLRRGVCILNFHRTRNLTREWCRVHRELIKMRSTVYTIVNGWWLLQISTIFLSSFRSFFFFYSFFCSILTATQQCMCVRV